MISTFAADIIWLGGGEKQKAEGRETVEACFRAGKDDMIACSMSEEVYHSMDLGRRLLPLRRNQPSAEQTGVGSLFGRTAAGYFLFFEKKEMHLKRCTFITLSLMLK